MQRATLLLSGLLAATSAQQQPSNYRAFSIVGNANVGEELVCNAQSGGLPCPNDGMTDAIDGAMYLSSSDLELSRDGNRLQYVGIIFPSIALSSADANTLANSHLVFDIDEIHPGVTDAPVTVRIYGERNINAAPPGDSLHNFTFRTRTTASVTWTPPSSRLEHELLISPDVSTIVKEILLLPGWTSGNSMGFFIEYVSGAGVRWVEAYDVNPEFATRSGTSGIVPALEVNAIIYSPPKPPPPFRPPPPPPSPFPPGATCSRTPCLGDNSGCNGNLCLGDGDCDADSDCAIGLLCGTDNCGAFRQSTGWPSNGPGWDLTDDCCYSPGGLGGPNPMVARFKTCDVGNAQTSGVTLMHTAPTIYLSNSNHQRDQIYTHTYTSTDLSYDAPIRAVSLTALTSDGWCVEDLRANGILLDGARGVWLDNPVEGPATGYPLHTAYVTYTWRVPNPSRTLTLSWHTCDISNAQSNGLIVLHLSEAKLFNSQTRGAIVTTNVPGEARTVSLTALSSDGWCVEDLMLNGQSPNPDGQARRVWLDNPPEGFYGNVPVAITYAWRWDTVAAIAPLVCNYIVGDGDGATETRVGNFGSELDCANAVRNQYPLANGATYSSDASIGACYAEFGMHLSNGNTQWRTCLFGGWPALSPPPPPPPPTPECEGSRRASLTTDTPQNHGGVEGGLVAFLFIFALFLGAVVGVGGYVYASRQRGWQPARARTTPRMMATTAPMMVQLGKGEIMTTPLAGSDSAATGYQAPNF